MSDYGVEDHACRTMCLIRGGLSRKFKKLNYGKKKNLKYLLNVQFYQTFLKGKCSELYQLLFKIFIFINYSENENQNCKEPLPHSNYNCEKNIKDVFIFDKDMKKKVIVQH